MPQGKIRVRKKKDGSLSRFIQISGGKKLGIPAIFQIDEELDKQSCEYEIGEKGSIAKISVNGKEIPIDTELEEEKARKRKEAEERRKAEAEAERKARKEARQNDRPPRSNQPQLQRDFDIAARSKLPCDTRKLLAGLQEEIDNLSLRLQKGANFWEENKGKATLYQGKKGSRKRDIPDKLMQHLPQGAINYGRLDFQQLAQQTVATAQALYGQAQVKDHIIPTDGRLIVGIGGATVFEVGLTLHHIYGIPHIPASGIKGAVRSWMIQDQFEGSEAKALADRDFCDLFGCPAEWEGHKSWYERNKRSGTKDSGDQEGKIAFFDAFPTMAPVVEEDIMNVHYPKYYQGESAPTDYQQPNPISFLTVGHDTPFQFVIAAQQPKPTGNGAFSGQELLQVAFDWLQQTLTSHGLGAKTALGYGFFQAS